MKKDGAVKAVFAILVEQMLRYVDMIKGYKGNIKGT